VGRRSRDPLDVVEDAEGGRSHDAEDPSRRPAGALTALDGTLVEVGARVG
jgi:hypothetical protein